MSNRPLVIMAGGTGGHIFPALAVAQHLRELGVPLMWLGTHRGLESTLVPKAGYPLCTIAISGLRGKTLGSWLLAPFRLVLAVGQSLWLLFWRRPAAVLGMGGFVSGPGGLAAWLLRIPLLIHEQNAVAGLTNVLLSRLAVRVMEAFPGTFSASCGAVHTGNPVRQEILNIPPPAQRLTQRMNTLQLLIVGGSQGAQVLNQVVPAALSQIKGNPPRVWHQSGMEHEEATRRRYAELGIEARVEPFIEDMAAAYAWADLVICRAGALTVSELAAAGVASVLVPYPGAVDDHQTANARYLAGAGAAILLPQSEFDEIRLAALLKELQGSRDRLLAMAEKARELACANAAIRVAELCMEAANG